MPIRPAVAGSAATIEFWWDNNRKVLEADFKKLYQFHTPFYTKGMSWRDCKAAMLRLGVQTKFSTWQTLFASVGKTASMHRLSDQQFIAICCQIRDFVASYVTEYTWYPRNINLNKVPYTPADADDAPQFGKDPIAEEQFVKQSDLVSSGHKDMRPKNDTDRHKNDTDRHKNDTDRLKNEDKHDKDRYSNEHKNDKDRHKNDTDRLKNKDKHDKDRYNNEHKNDKDRHKNEDKHDKDRHKNEDKHDKDRHKNEDKHDKDRYKNEDKNDKDRHKNEHKHDKDRHKNEDKNDKDRHKNEGKHDKDRYKNEDKHDKDRYNNEQKRHKDRHKNEDKYNKDIYNMEDKNDKDRYISDKDRYISDKDRYISDKDRYKNKEKYDNGRLKYEDKNEKYRHKNESIYDEENDRNHPFSTHNAMTHTMRQRSEQKVTQKRLIDGQKEGRSDEDIRSSEITDDRSNNHSAAVAAQMHSSKPKCDQRTLAMSTPSTIGFSVGTTSISISSSQDHNDGYANSRIKTTSLMVNRPAGHQDTDIFSINRSNSRSTVAADDEPQSVAFTDAEEKLEGENQLTIHQKFTNGPKGKKAKVTFSLGTAVQAKLCKQCRSKMNRQAH